VNKTNYQNRYFSAENSANGTTVGTHITSGNICGVFAIKSSTGMLTVAYSVALNFEVTPCFAIIVNVQDNGTGTLICSRFSSFRCR
jgi:hypothetical protein